MSRTKPFSISKRVVWEAYKHVKANKGAAGVDASGGAGSNGTLRFQIEFDISGLGDGSDLTSAVVILNTNKGSVDSLDTSFFVGMALKTTRIPTMTKTRAASTSPLKTSFKRRLRWMKA